MDPSLLSSFRRKTFWSEMKAKCHRSKENYGHGMCRRCYNIWKTKELRKAVILVLGGKCNWRGCAWRDPRALQIDHIYGGGLREVRPMAYVWFLAQILRMPNPKKKYQLLCANHNWIKRYLNREDKEASPRPGWRGAYKAHRDSWRLTKKRLRLVATGSRQTLIKSSGPD